MTLEIILSYFLTGVVFLTIISVLVAAHEYGHYLFARMFNMGVEEFAIGMGKKLKVWRKTEFLTPVPPDYVHDSSVLSAGASFEGGSISRTNAVVVDTPQGRALKDETEFTVRMLPIGGFVRIKGMMPQDDGSETRIPGGFYSKPPWQRLVVLFAGPLFSVLSGMLVLVVLFTTYGTHRPVDAPVVEVDPRKPAYAAGLRSGDRILSVAGRPVSRFYDLVEAISPNAGRPLRIEYSRKGKVFATSVTPTRVNTGTFKPNLEIDLDSAEHGVIGVGPQTELVVLSFAEAVKESVEMPIMAVKGLFRIAERPSRIQEEAGGAITMVAVTHAATKEGIGATVGLAALLSISIGIFNLLPIPPLDGGQMIMAFAELLRGGRRLSIRVQQALVSAGMFLVLLLVVVVLFVDFKRFAGGKKEPPAATTREKSR